MQFKFIGVPLKEHDNLGGVVIGVLNSLRPFTMNILSITQNRFTAQFFAVLTIFSLLMTAFPVAFFVAEAASTGVTINKTTETTPVDVQANFVVSSITSGPATPDTVFSVSDGGNGGSFYNGTVGGACNSVSADSNNYFDINQNQGVCYANSTPGVYTITVQLFDAIGGNAIGEPKTLEITVTEGVVEDERKVDICHATGNGFNFQNVNQNSIGVAHGSAGANDGDIIPVIPDFYDGQNLATMYGSYTGAELLAFGCVPPVINHNDIKLLTACKVDETEEPISGWEMTFTNSADVYTLETGADGCVSKEVNVFAGPWFVIEESREDWVQEDVYTYFGEVVDMQGYDACKFFDITKVTTNQSQSIIAEPDYTCFFMNSEVIEEPICENLLDNGSFEADVVTNASKWQKFLNVTGWLTQKTADDSATTLEIHRDWSSNEAADGAQYVELDGDHSTKVLQTVATIPDATYELSWAFAPRHGIAAEQNHLSVRVNGVEKMSAGPATGSAGLDAADWSRNSIGFVADSASTEISFADIGPSNSFGTFLDDAQLCLVRKPDPKPPVCTITLTSDDTNTVEEKGGAFAKILSFIHPNWTTALAGASWIWGDDGVVAPTTDETQTFVNQFGWGLASVTHATLTIAADNSFSADLNGGLAGEDLGEFNFSATKSYDVTSLVNSGNNELMVKVKNFGGSSNPAQNPAGLYYKLEISGEGEGCDIPYEEEPVYGCMDPLATNYNPAATEEGEVVCEYAPKYGDYCGDDEINQVWEQCDGADVAEGEQCTDYCTLANQCSMEQLVKITLDDNAPASYSFDGEIYLGSATNPIPNGTWFNFAELGDAAVNTIANAADGLAVERKADELRLAVKGGNSRTKFDYAFGKIETKGIELGTIDKQPIAGWPLETSGSYPDVFSKDGNEGIDFKLWMTTGNDSVAVKVNQGEKYDCDECKAEVEARIVVRDSDGAEITNGGLGNLLPQVILGDGSTVAFGDWFKVSEVSTGTSAVWIDDAETVTNFSNPATKEGLFVSREGDGKVKIALYGFHNPGGDTNFESLRATIEFNDAKIVGGATTQLPSNYKLENHSETDAVNSNDNFDSFSEAANLESVDFDFWVDTAADGITITLDEDEVATCDDDTDPKDPVDPEPKTYTIEGYKYVMSSTTSAVPYAGWTIYASNGVDDPLSTTTDSNGRYYFEVEAGSWTVSEEMPEGWHQVQVHQSDYITLTDDEPLVCDFVVADHEPVQYLRISEAIDQDELVDWFEGYSCSFYNEMDEEDSVDPEEEPENPVVTTNNGGRSSGGRPRQAAPTPLVLGAATTNFCPFLVDYMQMGANNDRIEVMKLQMFLNIFVAPNPVTGVFGEITSTNVKTFQEKYRTEILDPWFNLGIVPHNRPTGFVYKTTLWKINSIVCPDYATLPQFEGESLSSNVALNLSTSISD